MPGLLILALSAWILFFSPLFGTVLSSSSFTGLNAGGKDWLDCLEGVVFFYGLFGGFVYETRGIEMVLWILAA